MWLHCFRRKFFLKEKKMLWWKGDPRYCLHKTVCEKLQAIIKETVTLEAGRALSEAHGLATWMCIADIFLLGDARTNADKQCWLGDRMEEVLCSGDWDLNFVSVYLLRKKKCVKRLLCKYPRSRDKSLADNCWIWKLPLSNSATMPKYCICFFLVGHWVSVGKSWIFSSMW